jgi:U3 small nucleolar RNA-associated protein 13
LKNYSKIHTIPVYEAVESFQLIGSLLDELTERYFITMGNEGVLKLWDSKTSQIIYKQDESLKIENIRRTDINLQQCIIQSIYVKNINTLVLITIDQLIVFIKLDKDLIRNVCQNVSPLINKDLFHSYKQLIGDHGEILDAQLINDNLLAVATNNEFVKIYDLNTWNCKLLKGHTDLVIALAVFNTPDQDTNYLASSSKDSTIRLWKISKNNLNNEYDYECVSTGIGHTQDVGALAFCKQKFDFLVSGSIDTTIKRWQIGSDLKLSVKFTVKAHDKDINSVCVSPNDKLIASGSSDKTIKV